MTARNDHDTRPTGEPIPPRRLPLRPVSFRLRMLEEAHPDRDSLRECARLGDRAERSNDDG